jgi:superfamily II DNA or RNA helicase
MLLIVPSILLVTQFYDSIMEFNYGLNMLHEWGGKVDFRDGDLTPVREANPLWNPHKIRLEEVMSERPRKWTGPTQPNIYIGTYQSLAKYPKEFFTQFHTVVCDEAHQSKAATLKSILSKTFRKAYNRFGVSGTFPGDDTLEILTIQSVLGPVITEVSANELVKLGTITPMRIKALVLNHNEAELSEKLTQARKMGAGADVYRYERDYCQTSERRLEFIRKLVARCDKNTLLLFQTIEHGQRLFAALKEALPDKEFYYIDGEISGKKRGEIKAELEKTQKVEYTVLNFGDFEVEVESDFKILLTGGGWKLAADITKEDDIDDGFLSKLRNKK